MVSVDVIIVAAGSGLRYGAPLPKQFCDLDGKPVVMHTINAFRTGLPEARIKLVISRDMEGFWAELCLKHSFVSPEIAYGGNTRWASVRNAIDALDDGADVIMVHDAVRPAFSKDLLDRLIATLETENDADGVIPAVAVTDSLRIVENEGRSRSIDRSLLRAVQTPQAFRADRLRVAYRLPYNPSFTDDASVMEAAGFSNLILVQGEVSNIKITNPGDMAIVVQYLK